MDAGFQFHPLQVSYVALFGAAAVACLLSTVRARRISDRAIRRGLVGLLLASAAWAGAHVGQLLLPTATLKTAAYTFGLLPGFATVFAWLYFCSAYTGRSYHQSPTYRRFAVLLYGGVVAVKLTNPLHGLYFAASFTTTPFPYLVIDQGTLHWLITGLAYVLSAAGFYMLLELLTDIEYDTTGLGFLFLLTGAPVLLDVVAYARPDVIVEMNYEPIGVAVFAVGVLYVTEESFLAVPQLSRQKLVDGLSEAVLFLDGEGRLLDFNDSARRQLPRVASALGEPATAVLPELPAPAAADGELVTVEGGGEPVHYLVRTTPLAAGDTTLGRALVLADVTELEHRRQELQRQHDQLDGFAAAVAHELRNSLGILVGRLELLEGRVDDQGAELVAESHATARRMEQVVDDLATLARFSKTVTDPPVTGFDDAVRNAWTDAGRAAEGLSLTVEGKGRVRLDRQRLAELVHNVCRIARRTDAESVRFALAGETVTVTTDGDSVAPGDRTAVFDYGSAVPDARTGMLFANVRAMARALGWSVALDDYDEGVRLRVEGVRSPSTDAAEEACEIHTK